MEHTLQLRLPNKPTIDILKFESSHYLIDPNSIEILSEKNLPPMLKYYLNRNIKVDQAIQYFLSRRTIPTGRLYSRAILNRLSFAQVQTPEEILKIQSFCNAMSPNDYYILVTNKSDPIHTEKFQKGLDCLALTGRSSWTPPEDMQNAYTFELSTDGVYAKCWQLENNKPYLYKAGTMNNYEAEAEEVASKIADILNINHIHYDLVTLFKTKCSRCPSMLTASKSIVMFNDVFTEYLHHENKEGNPTLNDIENSIIYANGDLADFYQMLLFDYLVGNRDRHSFNWGFYYNHDKKDYDGLFPIFDNNNSIDIKDSTIYSPILRGRTIKELAEYATRKLIYSNKMPNLDKLSSWYTDKNTIKYFKKLYKGTKQLDLLKSKLNNLNIK